MRTTVTNRGESPGTGASCLTRRRHAAEYRARYRSTRGSWFAGWNALLHNYTIEAAGFGWFEAGLTQTVREIPGFLAFTVAFWLMIVREQVLGYVALVLLGIGVALTGSNPTLMGVLISTFIMSVGFHYFETVNTSMQL